MVVSKDNIMKISRLFQKVTEQNIQAALQEQESTSGETQPELETIPLS